ncbi:dipeptide ABC transporter ATP-binding protein [Tistrella sp. BH-R2-4]|uniref:Dipeptide ABC transporter ATP-binding protein n=1 Tax=Tistrella arctica TaxID=3133430 RepID=A0ABU9YFF0_9PROT
MADPILIADDLARHYDVPLGFLKGHAVLKALDGVSFQVEPGRTLAVVGESGCGKSTLARQLVMIEKPTAGRLSIGGTDVASANAATVRAMRRRVQMVFQNPYASLNPRKTVAQTLDEPLAINTDLDRAARAARVAEMMAKVGLRPEQAGRYPHMFSGGQRQRVAIARALMLDPAVVVADEPVSALDVSIQAQVLNLLIDLQREFGVAYVFISHDLSVVRHIADEVMVMYLGRAVEQAPRDLLFQKAAHPYTRALLASTPRIDPDERAAKVPIGGELPSPLAPPPGCTFHRRCPMMIDRCAVERPELRPVAGRMVACHRAEEVLALD